MGCCVNVKVKYIRPEFNNLREWNEYEDNTYIGRRGIVFIKTKEGKERYPKQDSKWCNPFKIDNNNTREDVLEKYETYILEKIRKEPEKYDLKELINKNLGCWCHPERCHGDILIKLLNNI